MFPRRSGRGDISQIFYSTLLTYTLSILEESEGAMPRVQVDSNDGPLPKMGGELQLVSFMMQQAWKREIHHACRNVSGEKTLFGNIAELTSVRKTPAVFIFPQQTAEPVPVFIQVDIAGSNSDHLHTKKLSFILFFFSTLALANPGSSTISVP